MMENTSNITDFYLEGYLIMDQQRPLYFFVFLLLFVGTILINSLLIIVIYSERALHEPMYFFVCNLSCNGIYGSSSLMPHLLYNLSTQVYEISLIGCLIQIYCIHTFNIVELTILAVMGYDRYIAICRPLHYHTLMSTRRLQSLLICSWAYPFISFLAYESFTMRLSFCRNVIHKTHCTNFDLVKLSCSDTTVHSIVGLLLMGIYILPQAATILFSYVQILRVCIHASKESQMKAMQTCVPHLLTVLNYFLSILFEIIQGRFDISYLPFEFRTFMSLYFMIFPPLLNPIIYGISNQFLRSHIHKAFLNKDCFKSI